MVQGMQQARASLTAAELGDNRHSKKQVFKDLRLFGAPATPVPCYGRCAQLEEASACGNPVGLMSLEEVLAVIRPQECSFEMSNFPGTPQIEMLYVCTS